MALTRSQAREYKERWALVNAFTLDEWRRKTPIERLHDAADLMRWAATLSDPRREAEVEAVRSRWVRLHGIAGG